MTVSKAFSKSRKMKHVFSLFSTAFILCLSQVLYDLVICLFGNHIEVYTEYYIYLEMKLIFYSSIFLISLAFLVLLQLVLFP